MTTNIIQEIQEWNDERGNYTYDRYLEGEMLEEELGEYALASMVPNDLVDEADALADIIFVAVGSLYKLCGNDKVKFNDIMTVVTAANNLKGKEKDSNGKVSKPKNFEGPEKMIAKILFSERFVG